jgi:hypothetical protein
MKILNDIEETLRNYKPILKERFNIKKIGIFGSFIRGKESNKSDLDILVEFEENASIGLLRFVEIENFLSDLLGIKVDMVEKSSLKPRIGRHILEEVSYL